jgi:predicted house-cleaning noncanonical NTP pyrophosphatase (MazG superfamily)
MKEKIYNKLVRDKIPQIIKQADKKAFFSVVTTEEFKTLLLDKLIEELAEFKDTPNEEEFADILEVIDGLSVAFNLDMEKVLTIKAEKFKECGGFNERIVLEKVME